MKKVNLQDVKNWEAQAVNLYNKVRSGELSQEEARELMREVYEIGISYDYGEWYQYNANEDEYRQYWTKPALEETFRYYDSDLMYANMRKLLLDIYGFDSQSDYFDVQ